ncbi:NAD(P)/FAD-dependent oxidoreductase [Streptomyces sp. SR27]|uniref:flavin monoamine oxidase family protein n=1 Tax=Streptomyces sp. SR27 TaxID=3076630 RepID=UPI00295C1969|nr:NAD(P)/FAD-dependent oxidoreductase [Streptomyces sp. SR27]MDV9188896.1 NAD(P)/FAD-dependent oxidoreductase [Streptomyces sp. SR27]
MSGTTAVSGIDPKDTAGDDPLCDVIIVGAGLAGLIAARDLAEHGLAVMVLEARDRVGGRTWSRAFPGTDVTVDLGAEWVAPEHHTAIMDEYARYGIELEDAEGTERDLWLLEGDVLHGTIPFDGAEREAFDAFTAGLAEQATALAAAPPFTAPEGTDVPLADLLAGLPPRVAGAFAAYAASQMGALPAEYSALAVIEDLAALDSPAGDPQPADTFDPAAERRVKGGVGALAERIAASLADRVRLGSPVTAIEQGATETAVTLTDGTSHRARAVVVALPVNTLSDVAFAPPLPEDARRLAAEGHTGRAVKVIARTTGVPADASASAWPPGIAGVYGIGPAASDTDETLTVCFGVAETLDAADPQTVTAGLVYLYPQVRVVETYGHDWNADPYAKGAWAALRPGQWTLLATFQRPHGRMVFAGSDISPVSHGFMDGAVVSGHQAARTVVELLAE